MKRLLLIACLTMLAPAVGAAQMAFGPYGSWCTTSDLCSNAGVFTGTRQLLEPNYMSTRLQAARAKGKSLIVVLVGGNDDNYKTGGKFDPAKWKKRMDIYNTTTSRNLICAAVADGTIRGNILVDEPERSSWGNNTTKAMMGDLADYARRYLPCLPMGVGHGPPAYKVFDVTHTYAGRLDFIYYQYNWNVSTKNVYGRGDIDGWRKAVETQCAKEQAACAYGLNLLDGGVRDNDNDGRWECPEPLTEGQGTYYPNCRMTAAQVRDFGKKLAPFGCYLLMWKYEGDYMRRSDNANAFADVASFAAGQPNRACKPGAAAPLTSTLRTATAAEEDTTNYYAPTATERKHGRGRPQ